MSEHDDDPVTRGGSQILRYGAPQTEWVAPPPSTAAGTIERHMATCFGAPSLVYHEVLSHLVHVDVHVIPPAADRACWTLFTTGMSDRPMTVPPQAEKLRFAELMLRLPADWPIDTLKATPPPPDLERWYWPIRWLKKLARFPHEHRTWLGPGHTLPNGDPPQPFVPSTSLCCWLLLPPIRVPAAARTIALDDGRTVHVYVLHALHAEEMALKLDRGTGALLSAFDAAKVGEVLDVARPPVSRKKLFGLL